VIPDSETTMKKLLTIDDLIAAFIEEAKFRDAHQDLSLYYKKRLDLLKKLFQCDLKKRQKELDQVSNTRKEQRATQSTEKLYEISGSGTVTFFEHCIGAFNGTKSPFKMAVYLEGMPPKIVRKLEEQYGKKIGTHEQELNRLNRLLIKEVLKYLLPGIEKKEIPEAKLFEMGLPKEEPDPDDYW
jgi:hypothetical protein